MSVAPWRRHLALACLCAGLAASPALDPPGAWLLVVVSAGGALAVAAARGVIGLGGATVVAAALALVAGLGVGDARLAASDAGAYGTGGQAAGERVEATGFVATQPRPLAGSTRFALETGAGRLGIAVAEPLPDLRVGDRLAVTGRLGPPEPWLADRARRDGWALEVAASEVRALAGARTGLTGYLDRARTRAEAGLTAGLDPAEAALARGFVLGQDDAIEPPVRDEFKRSGLAHLLRCYVMDRT